jgi:hypothetical protein
VLFHEGDDVEQVLTSLGRTPAGLLGGGQLEDDQIRFGGEAQLETTGVDEARSRDRILDAHVFGRKLDSNALGTRTWSRGTPIVAMRLPGFVDEPRLLKCIARNVGEVPQAPVSGINWK